VKFSETPLSTRARNVIRTLGISGRLESYLTDDLKFVRIKMCGKKTLAEIRKWDGTTRERERERLEKLCEKHVRYLKKRGYKIIRPEITL